MKKGLFLSLLTLIVITMTTATCFAGGRYYSGPRYHHPHYSHGPRIHHHSYHYDRIWAGLGIGLLTGAVIGTIVSSPPPPRQPTVVYTSPPPVIVRSAPVVQPVYVQPEKIYPIEPERVLRQVTATAQLLNMRSGPDLGSDVVGQVRKNQTLNVIGAAPDWLYIKTDEGYYGWVMTQYTATSAQPVG